MRPGLDRQPPAVRSADASRQTVPGPLLSRLIAALLTILASAGCAGPAPSRAAVVTVDLSGGTLGVLPDRYLGLSFESSSLDSAQDFEVSGNLPRLLENLGPGVLRFGGNSVDQPGTAPSPAALAALARLVRLTRWNVIFSVSLGQFSAAQATRDAAEASQALGPALTAIACGNEPDDFAGNGVRPASFTEAGYLSQAQTCIQAVRAAVPNVGIAGPDTSHAGWLARYASAERSEISLLTQHYYPLSDCHGRSGTAATLLSRATARAAVHRISAAAAAAHAQGVPLRISETNSASCGGIPGVSNTFASALWAVDYLLTGAQYGVSGMNFHGSMTSHCNAYSPLCRTSTSRFVVRPIYYGLLFTRMLGTGRLLPVTTRSRNLAAHALRSSGGNGPGRARESRRPGPRHLPARRNQFRCRDGRPPAPSPTATGVSCGLAARVGRLPTRPDPHPGRGDPAFRDAHPRPARPHRLPRWHLRAAPGRLQRRHRHPALSGGVSCRSPWRRGAICSCRACCRAGPCCAASACSSRGCRRLRSPRSCRRTHCPRPGRPRR